VITSSSDDGALAALFLNYPQEMGTRGIGSEQTYADTRHLAQTGSPLRVRHTLEGLPPGARFTVEVLDWDHGNVAEVWHGMGAPLNLSRAQTADLREAADRLDRSELTASADGVLEIDVELPAWAVMSVVQTHHP
jgi:xylan 1,4-beta-xylosidase